MTRRWLGAAAAALVLAAPFLPGCGSDSLTLPETDVIPLRNGTWRTVRTVTVEGPDTCQAFADPPDTTEGVLCDLNPASGGSNQGFLCEVTVEGDRVTYACDADLDVGPCVIDWSLAGGGTVTDTSFALEGSLITRVLGDDPTCAQYENPCTTRVTLTGEFLSTAGADSLCGGVDAAVRTPVAVLVQGLLPGS